MHVIEEPVQLTRDLAQVHGGSRGMIETMPTRPHIGLDERRARVGVRHRLATPGPRLGSVAAAARAIAS